MTENKKKEAKIVLTPEQQKALKEARAKERKEDLERAGELEKRLPKMSFRQVRGALKSQAKRPNDGSPLTSAIALTMLTVLDNTKTRENPFAKLQAYPR
jgi:hypothetical protein